MGGLRDRFNVKPGGFRYQLTGELPCLVGTGGRDLTCAACNGVADHWLHHALAVDPEVDFLTDIFLTDMACAEICKSLPARIRQAEGHHWLASAGIIGDRGLGHLESQGFRDRTTCQDGEDE